MVKRVYVEKRSRYASEASSLMNDLNSQLGLSIKTLRIIHRYDLEGISEDAYEKGKNTILAEPMVDHLYLNEFPLHEGEKCFAIEYLPGQYDVRADSCNQCFQILTGETESKVKCATVYVISGVDDLTPIEHYLINPVDSRLASNEIPQSLEEEKVEVKPVPTMEGFNSLSDEGLSEFIKEKGMAMNMADLKVSQDYFKNVEHRDPTETELRVLDTYWSDHCRHTTFSTVLTNIKVEDGEFKEILEKDIDSYKASRHAVYGINSTREMTLMDLATIAAKELRRLGYLDDMEVSEEINACSIEIDVHTNEGVEKWLLMFKNETHNHPTEIEPFGGAATCLGGCIRDPLSGRAYVYQSMRITGAGDPRVATKDTLKGKLPQRKLCLGAASGFSSYGNQIGLTTGFVHEIYDDGYLAKRMELGAVVAGAPKEQVIRLTPKPGQIVLLIGGRTGRDGIGGATGSSKSHELKTTLTAGAEVQKGNPVEERKIQRLFRNKELSSKIIRCNDFGAGGVSVAIGELADGLDINLDAVLKKYEGLNGTELAISESQERMAIVIEKSDKAYFEEECAKENLEVKEVAVITDNARLKMTYMGQVVVDIARSFLNQNGAKRYQEVEIALPDFDHTPFDEMPTTTFEDTLKSTLSNLLVSDQKGLVERFDSSIGNGTVLSPYGGKTLRTESEGMAALLPVIGKETTTCSLFTYGYNPKISKWSPYHGSSYAVVESISKIIAMGGDYHKIRFTYQEFFEKLLNDPKRWGKPFSSLLGAYRVQKELNLPSIGGKDSMSGSFEDIHVPPTLVSFAIVSSDAKDVLTPELKSAGHKLVELRLKKDKFHLFDYEDLRNQYDAVSAFIKQGKAYSAYTIKEGGVLEAVAKAAFGNNIGVAFSKENSLSSLIARDYGNIILEVDMNEFIPFAHREIGTTNRSGCLSYCDEIVTLDKAYSFNCVLEDVYPTTSKAPTCELETANCKQRSNLVCNHPLDEPLVVIPVFPGTNCEYDSSRAFRKAGARVKTVLIRNKTEKMINESIAELKNAIDEANIVMLPGGFSAGDEPEGSGKFIATVLKNPSLKDSITNLLEKRDGLMIGICNGFQALVKLGLLPYGKIVECNRDDCTLTFNTIGRHLSTMVHTRVGSVKSPWLANLEVGEINTIPISHGEGRFVGSEEKLKSLFENGQVAFQYVDNNNQVTMESPYNPNGSMYAIEGIISLDGRVIGKMGHSERQGDNRFKNVYGEMDQKIFEAGVNYFRGKK